MLEIRSYAINPPSVAAILELISKLHERRNQQMPWLLVDAALGEPQCLSNLCREFGWQAQSAFEFTSLARYGDHAPQLVALPERAEQITVPLGELVRRLPVPGVSVFLSAGPVSAIQSTLGYLGHTLVDGQALYCRFADVRVLPALLSSLKPPQLACLRRTITQWHWFDHLGGAAHWIPEAKYQLPELSESAGTDEGRALVLDSSQFDSLMRASEPDVIYAQIRQTVPALIPTSGLGEFRGKLETALATADAYEVQGNPDRRQFVALSLTCGEGFHLHPALAPTWAAVRERQTTLEAAMQQWDELIWEQLESTTSARRSLGSVQQ